MTTSLGSEVVSSCVFSGILGIKCRSGAGQLKGGPPTHTPILGNRLIGQVLVVLFATAS